MLDDLRACWMLIGLDAVGPDLGSSLVAEVIFPRSTEELFEVGGAELLLFLSLTLFEPPNQRLFRALEDGARLWASASTVDASAPLLDAFSFCRAWVRLEAVSVGGSSVSGIISTSSASRYHFLRRVYRSQPSWPRRPSFHWRIS